MNNEEFASPFSRSHEYDSYREMKEYCESLVKSLDVRITREMELRFESNSQMVALAKASLDKELAHLNALREEYNRKSLVYVTKDSLDRAIQGKEARFLRIENSIEDLQRTLASDKGKVYGLIIAAGIIFSIVQLLVHFYK